MGTMSLNPSLPSSAVHKQTILKTLISLLLLLLGFPFVHIVLAGETVVLYVQLTPAERLYHSLKYSLKLLRSSYVPLRS